MIETVLLITCNKLIIGEKHVSIRTCDQILYIVILKKSDFNTTFTLLQLAVNLHYDNTYVYIMQLNTFF